MEKITLPEIAFTITLGIILVIAIFTILCAANDWFPETHYDLIIENKTYHNVTEYKENKNDNTITFECETGKYILPYSETHFEKHQFGWFGKEKREIE